MSDKKETFFPISFYFLFFFIKQTNGTKKQSENQTEKKKINKLGTKCCKV